MHDFFFGSNTLLFWQNLGLIVKTWTFLAVDIFKCTTFLRKYVIIPQKNRQNSGFFSNPIISDYDFSENLHRPLKQLERLLKKAEFRKNAENFHVRSYPTCMRSGGFSITEENACLMLFIATGGKCLKIVDNFSITVDKICLKVVDKLFKCFH